ncbi:unnamed protein product [Hermetia illucens]|uniref:Uncharacterized protein n=1 Tax=Hermetia illucens TaxID=343691 RepID=A0A7R8UAJ6_HERIL|nr:uncharacterized protein LOC119659628 [Hermetia illucens]CAD7077212.1 unnamed protein product [Hermetia illucens]
MEYFIAIWIFVFMFLLYFAVRIHDILVERALGESTPSQTIRVYSISNPNREGTSRSGEGSVKDDLPSYEDFVVQSGLPDFKTATASQENIASNSADNSVTIPIENSTRSGK